MRESTPKPHDSLIKTLEQHFAMRLATAAVAVWTYRILKI
jgi:hypothetical protein